MAPRTQQVEMSEEEYIQYELNAEVRHEYVNGKLITMPGESIHNNKMAMLIAFIFMKHLQASGYYCYMEGVKLKIPGEEKYFYPDVFVTKESETNGNEYIRYAAEIIVEVLSDSTRKYDSIDKFINYQKIESLQYYILIEPKFTLVTLYSRLPGGDWEMESYTRKDQQLSLSAYGFTVPLSELYK